MNRCSEFIRPSGPGAGVGADVGPAVGAGVGADGVESPPEK